MIAKIPVQAILVMIWLLPSVTIGFQSKPSAQTSGSSSISGRVTISGGAAPHSTVILTIADESSSRTKLITKTSTDEQGEFRFADIAAGNYRISAFAPAHAVKSGLSAITVADGEQVEGANIDLVPGGVITGRVTFADGQPAVGEEISIFKAAPRNQGGWINVRWSFRHDVVADDRGIYRAYGLEAGRYLVGAGIEAKHWSRLQKSQYNPLTYHPNSTDQSKARVIEISSGLEVTDVNIVMASPAGAFTASGCVVNGETGERVPGIKLEMEKVVKSEGGTSSSVFQIGSTDTQGCFRLTGLTRGSFNIRAAREDDDNYSDASHFEIQDRDIDGLTVKLHKGGSISGIVVIEGDSTPAAESLSRLVVWAMSSNRAAKVEADGSFRVSGVRPGAVRLRLIGSKEPLGVLISRIEHSRITLENGDRGIEAVADLQAGEHLQGVQIFLSRVTGGIRGRVIVTGGKLPVGNQLRLTLWRPSGDGVSSSGSQVPVDPNGNFEVLGLPPNDYRLEARAVSADPRTIGRQKENRIDTRVTIGQQVETVEIIIDLSKTDR